MSEAGARAAEGVASPQGNKGRDPMVACKRCGQDGLEWEQTEEGKWRLKDDQGNFHRCAGGQGGKPSGARSSSFGGKKPPPSCKKCGKQDLRWQLVEQDGQKHACEDDKPY